MNNKEAELVQLSNCLPYNNMSYNIRCGGSTGEITPDVKTKISKTLTGRKFTEEHKKKIGLGNKNKKKTLTDKQRRESSERTKLRFKGKPKTEEHKKKIGLGNKGKKRTDDVK